MFFYILYAAGVSGVGAGVSGAGVSGVAGALGSMGSPVLGSMGCAVPRITFLGEAIYLSV